MAWKRPAVRFRLAPRRSARAPISADGLPSWPAWSPLRAASRRDHPTPGSPLRVHPRDERARPPADRGTADASRRRIHQDATAAATWLPAECVPHRQLPSSAPISSASAPLTWSHRDFPTTCRLRSTASGACPNSCNRSCLWCTSTCSRATSGRSSMPGPWVCVPSGSTACGADGLARSMVAGRCAAPRASAERTTTTRSVDDHTSHHLFRWWPMPAEGTKHHQNGTRGRHLRR
jgi:hypothetical protein